MMKRRVLALALILVLSALISSGTVAYFTTQKKTNNVITTGHIDIRLIDTGARDSKQITVTPLSEYSREVSVKNTGNHPAWVRIALNCAVTLSNGSVERSDEWIRLHMCSADWVEQDGYYYYTKPLQPNETTPLLMDKVTFGADIDESYENSRTTLDIIAYGVQVENNGDTYLEAQGWPEA